jgi:hypothetical protein
MNTIECTPAPAQLDLAVAPAGRTERHRAIALSVATILTGLFAGFFLTYSASVVLGLAQVDDVTYVRSFQGINATIRNVTFATFFFGCVQRALAWSRSPSRAACR